MLVQQCSVLCQKATQCRFDDRSVFVSRSPFSATMMVANIFPNCCTSSISFS